MTSGQSAHPNGASWLRTFRFVPLFVMLVLMLILQPIVEPRPLPSLALLTLVILAGAFAVQSNRRLLIAAIGLLTPAVVMSWISGDDAVRGLALTVLSRSLVLAFLVFVCVGVVVLVIRERRVTPDTIIGAVCGYLLLGFVFAFIYALVTAFDPAAVAVSNAPPPDANDIAADPRLSDLIHFSFVTMTTVGYGDTLPGAPITRSLAMVEAVLGQIYLAAFMAYLVGVSVARHKAA